MKERPILFSAPMVRAILEGLKTQTRRVVASRHVMCVGRPELADCPYGEPGDRLWVRETFRFPACLDAHPPAEAERRSLEGYDKPWCPTEFVADGVRVNDDVMRGGLTWGGWGKQRPGIHMPRWASRITLQVTSVRVERLQAITEEDAIAESCQSVDSGGENYLEARDVFADLWNTINGTRAPWSSNPWVWVIGFEVHS